MFFKYNLNLKLILLMPHNSIRCINPENNVNSVKIIINCFCPLDINRK